MSDWTEQDLEQAFEDRQETPESEQPEPEAVQPEPEQPEEGQDDEEGAGDEPAPDSTPSEQEQATRLYNYLRSRPDIAEALVGVEQGRYAVIPRDHLQQPEPEPEPQAPSIDFWADPESAFKTVYERIEENEKRWAAKQETDTVAAINTGTAVFQRNHPDLKPDEVEQVKAALVAKGTLPSYWSRNPNYVGVSEALEEQYRVLYFDRSRDVAAKDIVKASKAKRRAASVGGSRASSPRTTPVPTSAAERRAAMVRELEEAMNGA